MTHQGQQVSNGVWDDWRGCYEDGWQDVIVPEAYVHPAKFARGLIERIIHAGLDEGWWQKGDLLADPFGGVGLGGIIAAYNGLRWRGVELEENFCMLAERNFAKHHGRWKTAGDPEPVILQGDSRNFAAIVGECSAICTSPPYADSAPEKSSGGIDIEKQWQTYRQQGGGSTLEAFRATQGRHAQGYGSSPGQIGALKAGDVDGIVTSPPFADCGAILNVEGRCRQVTAERAERLNDKVYGTTSGQIGAEKTDTYWEAMRDVYQQCRLALKPKGVMVVVIKDHIKDGKRVPLCDQTCKLLQACGFAIERRIRAWLVSEDRQPGLFGEVVKRKGRKSFFRRLYESRLPDGDPRRIDWEEVIVACRGEETDRRLRCSEGCRDGAG